MNTKVSKYVKRKQTVILASYQEPKDYQVNASIASYIVEMIAPMVLEGTGIRIGQGTGYLLRDKLAINEAELMDKFLKKDKPDLEGYMEVMQHKINDWLETEEFKKWLDFDAQHDFLFQNI